MNLGYHLATAVAQTYKTMIETQQLSLLQMQCRVHKVPLGGRCWYSGGLPERNLCESSMILKSFNDMEHARRRFSANIPCLGLTSVVSFSDEMTFLCPKCFSDGATFSSPTFSCAAHTHTHSLIIPLKPLAFWLLRYQSVNLCLLLPFWLGYKQARKKSEVAAGNGKWLQKYCGRQSFQLHIKCNFLQQHWNALLRSLVTGSGCQLCDEQDIATNCPGCDWTGEQPVRTADDYTQCTCIDVSALVCQSTCLKYAARWIQSELQQEHAKGRVARYMQRNVFLYSVLISLACNLM